jgi:hypothetical protein
MTAALWLEAMAALEGDYRKRHASNLRLTISIS